jgi:hypothetical protein
MCGMCHGSADISVYDRLCFVLKQAACNGNVFGYIAAHMVIKVKFC